MKILVYSLLATTLCLASCNNAGKKASATAEEPSSSVEAKAVQKTFSDEEYNVFLTAALENQMAVVKEKLAAGMDVNYANENKRTALMLAAFNGHSEIVDLLLKAGAQAKMVDMTNRSALMFASTGPFVETVKLLLAAGSEVNAMDSHESWTPVMFASGEGQIEVVKVLIAAGADISMVDVDGESSYDFAVSNGHTEMAAYLKELAQKQK